MRVAVLSHGHPEMSTGGGERAAYSLFRGLKEVPSVTPSFVARADAKMIGHDGWFGAFRGRADECLWALPDFDWFRRVTQRRDTLLGQIQELGAYLCPDIVHFHHYIFFGLDALELFKEVTKCKVVLTLHEYALICNNDGQMVKTGSSRLCHAASPAECSNCFPAFSSGQFFLREELIKRALNAVDAFISPSAFLKGRYSSWGIEADKIHVIENLLPKEFETPLAARAPRSGARRLRLGFFGQLTPFKGADLLLKALDHLPPAVAENLEIILFGANLETQPQAFRDAFTKLLETTTARVSFFGPYRNEDVRHLMSGIDWIVVPSIWWENSPLVIQEAKSAGVPLLCSNIGGMAEKVRDGVDGLHFLAGSAMDLAQAIEGIFGGEVKLSVESMDVNAQNREGLERHLDVYEKVLSTKGRQTKARALLAST